MLTAIILNVPIPLFSSNTLGITWTICWWLANYSPGNIVGKILALAPVRIPAKVRHTYGMQDIPFSAIILDQSAGGSQTTRQATLSKRSLIWPPCASLQRCAIPLRMVLSCKWHMSESCHHHTLRLSGLHLAASCEITRQGGA